MIVYGANMVIELACNNCGALLALIDTTSDFTGERGCGWSVGLQPCCGSDATTAFSVYVGMPEDYE